MLASTHHLAPSSDTDATKLLAKMLQQTDAILANGHKLNENLKKLEEQHKVNIFCEVSSDEK